MASMKERIENVFAAMAFAERSLDEEALEVLRESGERNKTAKPRQSRPDNRSRMRV